MDLGIVIILCLFIFLIGIIVGIIVGGIEIEKLKKEAVYFSYAKYNRKGEWKWIEKIKGNK